MPYRPGNEVGCSKTPLERGKSAMMKNPLRVKKQFLETAAFYREGGVMTMQRIFGLVVQASGCV
jgi:hypothetical protein